MSGRRTWHRVEAPGTHRGHAMMAHLGADQWAAWELPDGRWGLSYGTLMGFNNPQAIYDDWSSARKTAERLRDRPPLARNPIDPLVALAAGAGVSAVMRNAVNQNPSHYAAACSAATEVRKRIPSAWLVGAPHCGSDGSVTVAVVPGYRWAAREQVAQLPFRVHVVERTPRPRS